MLINARRRAKRDGLAFDLTLEDIHIPQHCPVLGIRLARGKNGRQCRTSPSLDRVIPRRGYTRGNVLVVSWRANELKKNATPEELERVAAFYRQLIP
jgi:hypothetical protein